MAAATPLMPDHDHGARLYVRKVVEEACEGLLRRLQEDDLPTEASPLLKRTLVKVKPPECDGVRRCAEQLQESVGSLAAPRDTQEVAHLLAETCGCDLLPPGVLEALAQRLIDEDEYDSDCENEEYLQVVRIVQKVLLREEKLAAFFTDETTLSFSLFQEMKGLLRGRHWDRLRIQCGYLAEEKDPMAGSKAADPEVQLPRDAAPTAYPEVQPCVGSGSGADPEVHVFAAGETKASAGRVSGTDPEVDVSAATQGQHVNLAIGDRSTELGFYMELKKNPKDKKALQGGRDKLRSILGAESVTAPGSFNTTEENRVCYQIIFYTPGGLAKGAQHPEEMEKLLRKHGTWKHVIDYYDETWSLPKREVGACILEVRPDF